MFISSILAVTLILSVSFLVQRSHIYKLGVSESWLKIKAAGLQVCLLKCHCMHTNHFNLVLNNMLHIVIIFGSPFVVRAMPLFFFLSSSVFLQVLT